MKGYNLPVVTNINLINPTGTLADGRPIFSTAVNATTRVDPRYNVINSVQSPGESTYKNMTLQLTRRQYKGIGFDFAYTLGKSEDNAPITSTLSVQGDAGRVDLTNLDRDLGPNILDQRHTFVGSIVATPQFERGGTAGAILNNNVFGLAIQLASGIPVNLRSNLELNNDGTASDRPLGVARNSLTLPARKNVDFRYSRKIPHLRADMAAEVIAEVKNLFNTEQVSSVNATVTTNAQGVPTARAADVGRPADADRRLRAAPVPARVQVHLLVDSRQPRRSRRPRSNTKTNTAWLVCFVVAFVPFVVCF